MKKILCLVCILLVSGVDSAFAYSLGGADPGAINTQYMKDIRTFDMRSRAKQKSAIVKKQQKEETQQVVPVQVADLKSITFVNNNSFTSSQLMSVVQDKINQPMNIENLSALRKRIMRFYQDNGFYSAVAIIVGQDSTNGEVVIRIDEGTRNSIIIE